jgi:hypothetical protein
MDGAQLIEKNHFLGHENRATTRSMHKVADTEVTRRRARLLLLLMAAAIAAATIAPMAVLAG